MRSAPEFQVQTRPAPSSMKIATSWTPSTSCRKVSEDSRGVVTAGITRFASIMTSMPGRTFHASLWQRRAPVAAPQHWKPAWRMSRGAARTRAPRPVHHIRARRESPLFRRVRLRGRSPRGAGIRGRTPPARIRLGRRQQRGLLDSGFPGLILRLTIGGIELRDGPSPEVRAGAGVDWDGLVQAVVARGWTGVECLSGIPGTVGGTPIQNVGAYGQEIAESLVSA